MTRVDVQPAGVRLPSGGFGCTRPLALIGVVWIILSALAISQWDSLYVLARVGAIIFIVLGILCTLPLLGLWSFKWWVKRFTTRLVTHLQTVVEEETRQNQDLYGGDLQFRPAEESDLTGAEREPREQLTAALLEAGCTLVGDVVNVKADPAGDAPGVQRMLVSGDGKSWLAIRRDIESSDVPRIGVDIVSEFLDDTFRCTSNIMATSRRTLPPQLRIDISPPDTEPGELLRQHETSLTMLTSSEALVFTTLADVLASLQRKYVITRGYQKMLGP